MTEWTADRYQAQLNAGGRELRLEVDASGIPGSTAWYWRVRDEEGKIVRDGCRDTPGQAKSSATRAAKAFLHRWRRTWHG